MTPSWTSCPVGLLPVPLLLLLLLQGTGTASGAALARGRTARAGEEAGPLALVLLRRPFAGSSSANLGAAMSAEAALLGADAAVDGDALGDALSKLGGVVDVAAPSAPRMVAASDGDLGDTALLRATKRQVRYHQCYFNPISCFG